MSSDVARECAAQMPSEKQGALSRVENLLGWPDSHKILLVSTIFLSFESCFLIGHLLLAASESATFVSETFAPLDLRIRVTSVTAWVAFSAFAFSRRRRREPDARLVDLFMIISTATVLYNAWIGGTYSQMYVSAAALGSLSIGSLLFTWRAMAFAVAMFVVGFAILTVLQILGAIPYAPLLTTAPFSHGRLSGTWLVGHSLISATIMVFAALSTMFITHLWRDREEQLSNTTELISRYVASQVAEEIKAGNFDVVDRQRRQKLTLFFSDIKGFSATADVVEPEDLALVLNEYLAEMTAIARRYEATVDKFVGDAIMIFFGAPRVTTDRDHALRAVRMAIDMQERMVELGEKWRAAGFERPFQIRIGINTGQVSLGNFGSSERVDYTAIGRQVNLAARLESRCTPGKVLISHATWALVEDEVPCQSLGEIRVDGFTQPVRVYEVA